METLLAILIATSVIGLIGLVGAFTLLMEKRFLNQLIPILVAFAAGALLAGGFFHLLAEALEKLTTLVAFSLLLVGFVIFFALEKVLLWHHCHKIKCKTHPFSYLILVGDGFHNLIDGIVIAAGFMVNINLGIVTTLLIILHEIPQELGNFGILLHGGFSKLKALFSNFGVQLTCILGGLIGYFASSSITSMSTKLLPVAAGGFIYIAASDLIPELHHEKDPKKSLKAFLFFCIGVVFMITTKLLLE